MFLLGYIVLLLHTVRCQDCQSGQCIVLDECPSAKMDLKTRKRPVICGWSGVTPKVCCTPVSPVPEPIQDLRISEKKCGEYTGFVKGVFAAVGGVDALPTELPHMALLGYDAERNVVWSCGGSLISERFILTAAHCTYHREYGSVSTVRLGELVLNSTTDKAYPKDFRVTDIYTHQDYNPPSKYNDIALLKLNESVTFDEFIRPACLYGLHPVPPYYNLTGSGWGALEFGGRMHNHLQIVSLEYVPEGNCSRHYTPNLIMKNGYIDESQLCAGGDGKDTCQGDSGGPLQMKTPGLALYKTYTIIGITSVGKNCGIFPGIYTRVSHYITWIENIVWPNL